MFWFTEIRTAIRTRLASTVIWVILIILSLMKNFLTLNTLSTFGAGNTPKNYDWISFPWDDTRLIKFLNGKLVKNKKFDGDPRWKPLIIKGFSGLSLEEYNGKPIYGGTKDLPWHEYVHIFQPPTEYTWGVGRMWNRCRDGNIYYKTVCLPPTFWAVMPGFSLIIDPGVGKENQIDSNTWWVEPGKTYNSKLYVYVQKEQGTASSVELERR